ncbi:sugar dehydrogenase complex small subunit [uncultured Celeribacter sp.]|uniref:sugar dehydrogenase complex small subunit n=1 Tax=uncultured Celeribacter sp. TaxID=1303376 RepID=UPI002AA8A20A|nr:sugar dehydrogenase complex small subunit [uncultured Celeribacter sp.]
MTDEMHAVTLTSGPAVSRRRLLLLSSVSVFATALLGPTGFSSLAARAETVAVPQTLNSFMAFSKFATGHVSLDGDVGSALLSALAERDPAFLDKLAVLGGMVEDGSLPDVDTMEEHLRGTVLHDTLLRVVRAWYSGVTEEGSNAPVYAYEKALMYQPARDGVIIPTFARSGPNYWTAAPPPLAHMPEF